MISIQRDNIRRLFLYDLEFGISKSGKFVSTDEFGEFINRDLYLPKKHLCKPLAAKESEEEQQILASTSISIEKRIEKLFEEQKNNLRRLFLYDLEFGISQAGKSMIIICEPLSGRQLVREFIIKSEGNWQGIRCVQKKKPDTYILFNYHSK
uniref:WYL domain-containing protein n=1 Tax=Panagrolaimus sp. PS1159 TaxID=55785 RepID=A0AC35FWT3_9BILA